jgi:hypothetical protein
LLGKIALNCFDILESWPKQVRSAGSLASEELAISCKNTENLNYL